MSDATVFVLVFIALLIIRVVIATVFFLWVLPEADRCPICDSPTLRYQSAGWNRILPWIRTSWCTDCGWQGLQRPGRITPPEPGATGRKIRVPKARSPQVHGKKS